MPRRSDAVYEGLKRYHRWRSMRALLILFVGFPLFMAGLFGVGCLLVYLNDPEGFANIFAAGR